MHIFYGYLIVKCVTPTQFSQDILLFKSSDIERKIKRREREREREALNMIKRARQKNIET